MWNAQIFLHRIKYGAKRKLSSSEPDTRDENPEGGTSTEHSGASTSAQEKYIIMAREIGVPDNILELFKPYLNMLEVTHGAEHYTKFKEIGKWFYKPKEQKLADKDYGKPKRCAENSLFESEKTGKRIAVGFMFLEGFPIPIEHIVNLDTVEKSTVVYDRSPGSKGHNTWYFLVETSPVLLKHLGNNIPDNRANPPEMLLDAWRFFDKQVRKDILEKSGQVTPFWEIT